ncbi:Inactive receptor-like protein kinase [Senna tora]|uniref:Inactive receptor-like protein kinase n=1 Tax=Senna tora TaxID=362788 RepID=A0A834THD3_9FABA|nr:Inactive receptor-like protein kinase [Senna tora]
MASLPHGSVNCRILLEKGAIPYVGISALPFLQSGGTARGGFRRGLPISLTVPFFKLKISGTIISRCLYGKKSFALSAKRFGGKFSKNEGFSVPRSSNSSNSSGSEDVASNQAEKTPFGYTRKDVLLIGVGVTVLGIGLKSGLEFVGVDPLQAGNVVQLVLVLGLTVGWISTYIFRVSNKEMTYAQQLRDYEKQVMEKRLEGLTEAELEALLEQVEEEKRRLASGEQVN